MMEFGPGNALLVFCTIMASYLLSRLVRLVFGAVKRGILNHRKL